MAYQARFPLELTAAIAASGMSLADIAQQLTVHGYPITGATLSYWKTGRSLPRRKSSLPAITELESVLGLTPGTLTYPLHEDLQNSGSNTATHTLSLPQGTAPQHIDDYDTDRFKEPDDLINWEYEVQREVYEETMIVSPDFRSITINSVVLARIPHSPQAHMHVGCFFDSDNPPSDDAHGLHHVQGAIIGDTTFFHDKLTEMVRLDIPSGIAAPGDICRIAYSHVVATREPVTETVRRFFSWPLRMYTCHVVFEGTMPPHIEFELAQVNRKDYSVERTIIRRPVTPMGNTVQIALENVTYSTGFFTWDSDGDFPDESSSGTDF